MNDIRRVVDRARWRLALATWLGCAVWCMLGALALAAALRVTQQMFALEVPWGAVAWGLLAGWAGVSVAWAAVARPRTMSAARRVDEGADLRDALATALQVAHRDDAWSRVVVEDAARRAREVDVARAVPIRAPRSWPLPLAAALSLLVLWLVVPPMDLLGTRAQARERVEQREEAQAVAAQAQQAKARVEQLLAAVEPQLSADGEDARANAAAPEPADPEAIRRAAIKDLAGMQERIAALQQGERAQKAGMVREMLRQARSTQPGPAGQMLAAMQQGDYAKAQQILDKMRDTLKGEVGADPAEQEATRQQLARLGEQLKSMAARAGGAEKKLAEMGLDPALAKDPSALAKALAEAGLPAAQQQSLLNMAAAQQEAQQAMAKLGQGMEQMAQGGGDQPAGEQGEGGEQAAQAMSEQLSELEMMQQEADGLEAAMAEAQVQQAQMMDGAGQCDNPGMGECEGGLSGSGSGEGGRFGTGAWQPGQSAGQGQGAGGPGQGQGGGPGEQVAEESWQKRKARAPLGGGPMIGSMLVEGEQLKGESRAALVAAVEAAAANASEAMENNVVPREYHDAIKHYFGRLQAKTKATPGQTTPGATPAGENGAKATPAPATPANTPATPTDNPK